MKNCTACRGYWRRARRGGAERGRGGSESSPRGAPQRGRRLPRRPQIVQNGPRPGLSDGAACSLDASPLSIDEVIGLSAAAAAPAAPLEPQGVALLHDAGGVAARRSRSPVMASPRRVLRAAPRVPPPRRHDEHARARRAASSSTPARRRAARPGGDGAPVAEPAASTVRRSPRHPRPFSGYDDSGRTPSRRRRPPATTSSARPLRVERRQSRRDKAWR